jgi:hypothetical protein
VHFPKYYIQFVSALLFALFALHGRLGAQTLGAITGTVKDSSGAAVGGATIKALNAGTNLEVAGKSEGNGSYEIRNLPVGTYRLSFTKDGFQTQTHTEVIVDADRTTTVDGALAVGSVSSNIDVSDVSLMNQVDATTGYVVDQLTIESTPLGTGSYTQLAIMSPGVHADFLGGSGANTGLGNQAIYSNGQRDTSNSFSLNGVATNNLFNGNSTSQVGENRFVLSTGETFGAANNINTSASVADAIGQSLPSPPVEAIQEISVNSAQYDATKGAHSGAQIGVITKSGTNSIHGSAWEEFQNSDLNAAPFFNNASPAITQKVSFLNRNQFGATIGGPIRKDKLFYFLSYQGIRVVDGGAAQKDVTVPIGLTSDRSLTGIVNAYAASAPGKTIAPSLVSPAALAILQATLPGGQFLIPNPQITNVTQANLLGYDTVLQGPNATANVDQGIADIDYLPTDKDRIAAKVYIQNNPTTNPFNSSGVTLGFPQTLAAGGDVGSLTNTIILGPTVTWEQNIGFTRLRAYSQTSQPFGPGTAGITLPGNTFPEIEISNFDPTIAKGLTFGPNPTFGNAGMFQNEWQSGTRLNWVKGRHTLAFGGNWNHTQLNILNQNTNVDTIDTTSLLNFLEGTVKTGTATDEFAGSASRYYRANTAGIFVNDNYKVLSNLTVTAGLRWDFDGPFSEKYGRLTAFNGNLYSFNQATDTITNSGLEVAGNNPTFGTPGASSSLLTQHQWGFAPRIGVAWAVHPKITVRAGFGVYYDRGEYFSEFSPSAGGGFNGPFGATLAPPFVAQVTSATGATLANPFNGVVPPAPPGSAAAFLALLPNIAQTESGKYPAGNFSGPFLFGGYDANNKLPYTTNWSFDIQYQPSSTLLLTVGYVGNHGNHEVIPIPFNQPGIATASNPINGQTSSYGLNENDLEPISTSEFAGNAPIRVPYIGYDMNSVLYKAEGISNYNALQLQLRKRLSKGLQLTASYTWSHSLDDQSGLGLFYNGNNPASLPSGYASSDFDQTHVFLVNFSYRVPKLTTNQTLGAFVNGWTVGGQTVAQSGQPYSVYDYSGSVGSLYYGTDIELINPLVPLIPGASAKQAQLQGTLGVNAGQPVLNANDFSPQFVAPGTNGVPACDASGCDNYESLFGGTGRNIFRAPFQFRVDMSLAKEFLIREHYRLRFNFDGYNLFNHPDFDAPNNDVTFFPGFSPPPVFPPQGSLGIIQHTVGSPRFLQLGAHLSF